MNDSDLFFSQLCAVAGNAHVYRQEPMSAHTSFRIGGPAAFFVTPATTDAIRRVLALCKAERVPFAILGNGTNLLVSDAGYEGVILQLSKNFNSIAIEGTTLTVQAGALLSRIASEALKHGLTGFEFAGGIPGTLGGAVVMNAGAYGSEMKDVLVSATLLTGDGQLITLSAEELDLGYRTSIVARKGYLVLEAVLALQKGDPAAIQAKMDDLSLQRRTKQPLEYGSAGSTFKRPAGYFAGKLIQDAGLSGYRVGDAQVSEKHCGFVINLGSATAADVYSLIQDVIRTVREDSGVTLEPEVKLLGQF